jgi:hypothetical protein
MLARLEGSMRPSSRRESLMLLQSRLIIREEES